MSTIRPSWNSALEWIAKHRYGLIAALALLGISAHLVLRFGTSAPVEQSWWPLWFVLLFGGAPLTLELFIKLIRGEFGSDLLAGISIVTSVFLEEYLAGALVVLMLSGGEALEAYAVRNASKALKALAKRMPSIAHRRQDGQLSDVVIDEVQIRDELVVFPHEVCPVDGTVVAGHSAMDESYLTGEPYVLSKTPGSSVLSGAVNGDGALTVRADKLPIDSRYAKIVEVMRASEQQRPRLRRLGDQLGAFYTPLAVVIAIAAWLVAGDPLRFLAVLVVATPCPLLIAIPVTIIGAISLAARRGIIVRNPTALEQISDCRTAIFDKTGTLTYGQPQLVGIVSSQDFDANEVLALAASLERYSKHPLSGEFYTRRASANCICGKRTRSAKNRGVGSAVALRSATLSSQAAKAWPSSTERIRSGCHLRRAVLNAWWSSTGGTPGCFAFATSRAARARHSSRTCCRSTIFED